MTHASKVIKECTESTQKTSEIYGENNRKQKITELKGKTRSVKYFTQLPEEDVTVI